VDALVVLAPVDGRLEKVDALCGAALPRPVLSSGPRLVLELRGFASGDGARGFQAAYSFIENLGVASGQQLADFPCAFAFNASAAAAGAFASPNFPGLYPRDTECHYFFHGRPRQRVRLRFHYFDVEGVQPCEALTASDYVEFSNFMARDRKYSRYCGQLKALQVESDRKFFRVTFRSNDRLDGTGFNATYEFLDAHDASTAPPAAATGAAAAAAQGGGLAHAHAHAHANASDYDFHTLAPLALTTA
ncbi:Cubilin homolog, partial [Gryllus bimaculatus]